MIQKQQLDRLRVVFLLSAITLVIATFAVSSNGVELLAYASKGKPNCPTNDYGSGRNQATVQSASQVAIGNNIKQIIIQNGDQKSVADNNGNNKCINDHNHKDNKNHDSHYLIQNAEQNARGDNNNQYLIQNSEQSSLSGNLQVWIEHLKEKILSQMLDNMN
jgi:hypothetical protein